MLNTPPNLTHSIAQSRFLLQKPKLEAVIVNLHMSFLVQSSTLSANKWYPYHLKIRSDVKVSQLKQLISHIKEHFLKRISSEGVPDKTDYFQHKGTF